MGQLVVLACCPVREGAQEIMFGWSTFLLGFALAVVGVTGALRARRYVAAAILGALMVSHDALWSPGCGSEFDGSIFSTELIGLAAMGPWLRVYDYRWPRRNLVSFLTLSVCLLGLRQLWQSYAYGYVIELAVELAAPGLAILTFAGTSLAPRTRRILGLPLVLLLSLAIFALGRTMYEGIKYGRQPIHQLQAFQAIVEEAWPSSDPPQ